MNLIIDQGNTETKIAQYDGRKQVGQFRLPSADLAQIAVALESMGANENDVLVSSVVNEQLELPGKSLIHLSYQTPLPLVNRYASPDTLGNDRIANAVAVWTKNPQKNSLSVDIGTCIKYDLVSSNGEYLGGNISPGLKMRFKALHEQTARLPLMQPKEARSEFGTTTETSLVEGVQKGIEHEISGFIEQYRSQFEGLTIFMTGGDAKFFEFAFKNSIFADPDLTLFGLNEILIYNLNA